MMHYDHKSESFCIPAHESRQAMQFKTIEAARSHAFQLITPELHTIYVVDPIEGVINTVSI